MAYDSEQDHFSSPTPPSNVNGGLQSHLAHPGACPNRPDQNNATTGFGGQVTPSAPVVLRPSADSTAQSMVHTKIGSVGKDLSFADLATRVEMQGSLLNIIKHMKKQNNVPRDIIEMKGRLQDIEACIKQSPAEIDGVVKTAIRRATQECLFDLNQTKFLSVHMEFGNQLKHDVNLQKKLGVDKFMKVEPHKLQVIRMVGRLTSAARDQLRNDIIESVMTSSFKTLDSFTASVAEKYLHINKASIPPWVQVSQCSYLRVNTVEAEDDLVVAGEDEIENQAVTNVGGQRKGSFWQAIQIHIQGQIAKYGEDFTSESWKPVIEHILGHELDGYETLRGTPAELSSRHRQPLSNWPHPMQDSEVNAMADPNSYYLGIPGFSNVAQDTEYYN
ncbi:hypothetical protein L218DRAFT_992243 [Marasmius fiardii PR-910]|nr:hypothetical protein L218DRAFT_992243 [Marasmius fiardii PR-910]